MSWIWRRWRIDNLTENIAYWKTLKGLPLSQLVTGNEVKVKMYSHFRGGGICQKLIDFNDAIFCCGTFSLVKRNDSDKLRIPNIT